MDEIKDTVVGPDPAGADTSETPVERRVQELEQELGRLQRENELMVEMARRGVVDLEAAALLIHRQGPGADSEPDLEATLEKLRRERPWLFGPDENATGPAMHTPTAGARAGRDSRRLELDQAAQRARQSGKRRDLIAYLRLRRTRR